MFFFKLLALILGVEMVSLAPVFILVHKEFKKMLFNVLCPEQRPSWMWFPITGVAGLILLAWYVELTTTVNLSWIITLYLTLGFVKFYLIIFRYDQFRDIMIDFSRKERFFQWGLGSLIYFIGIFFLILGMFGF